MIEPTPLDIFVTSLFPSYGKCLEKQDLAERPDLHIVRSAYVYVIRLSGTSSYKIGYTRSPKNRLITLQISVPVPLEIFGTWVVPQQAVERQLHQKFAHLRQQGEWFTMTDDDLADLVVYMKDYKRVT